MKIRMRRHKGSGMRELYVVTRRHERVYAARILRLATADSPYLVPLSHEPVTRRGKTTLRFDITGLTSARRRTKGRDVSVTRVMRLCMSLCDVLTWCVRAGLPATALLFDARYVFVDDAGGLKVVYVPTDGRDEDPSQSVLGLLASWDEVARKHAAGPEQTWLADQLHAFVLDADGVFSLNRFRTFVAGMRQRAGDGEVGWQLVHEASGTRFEVPDDRRCVIGRAATCDLHVHWPKVSRSHAVVWCAHGCVSVMDLGSRNGTLVQGRRIEARVPARLRDGEALTLANETLRVVQVTKER